MKQNKYLSRIISKFPTELDFTRIEYDEIYKFLEVISSEIYSAQDYLDNTKANMYFKTVSPNLLYEYYDDHDFTTTGGEYRCTGSAPDLTTVNITTSGIMVDSPDKFQSAIYHMDIDLNSEDIYLSGIPEGSGLVGLSFGWDQEDSEWYVTASGSPEIFVFYSGAYFSGYTDYNSYDMTKNTQDYDNTNSDEYLNIVKNDPFVPADTIYAVLNHIPLSGTLEITDILNLEDPTDPENSDGTTVDDSWYTINWGTRVMYFPSGAFMESNYIAEYDYLIENNPKYLSQNGFIHNGIGTNSFPSYTNDYFEEE